MKNKKKMNTKESLNSKVNKLISAKNTRVRLGISDSFLRQKAKENKVNPVFIKNVRHYTEEQINLLLKNNVVKTKKLALICDLCEKFPSMSDQELSEIVGLKVSRPQFFIFESKMNKKL